MADQRLEQTIQRIERALARIAAAADAKATGESGSTAQDDALRSKVRAELEKLDRVIGELEK